jgi:hypothetical protein
MQRARAAGPSAVWPDAVGWARMGDIEPTKREQGDYNDRRHPRWRLLILVAGAGIAMLLWLLLTSSLNPFDTA